MDISTGLFHEISESSFSPFSVNLILFLYSLSQMMAPHQAGVQAKGWTVF